MGIMDRPGFARLATLAEERLNIAVIPASEKARFEVVEREFAELAGDAEDLAAHSLDYFGGRPQEMQHERRKRLAQRSRIALKFDPLAAAEAQLLGDFAFGRGVPTPTARDPKVQQIIDEAWTDANNEEKLTGFAAQRKLSNELLTAGELFFTLYERGGRVRVGRLDPDTVEAVVPDPEDRLRPLYYMARERRYEWDYDLDAPKVQDVVGDQGRPKVKYWPHWRNLEDAKLERAEGVGEDERPLEEPEASKVAKGVVFHIAVNQTGEELRGTPPWARSLRFFGAMNVLTEAHVTMAQGASTFIARRVMNGTPKQVQRAASAVLGHVSELGAARWGENGAAAGGENPPNFAPGAPPPVAPGSWWNENQSSKLEALNLNSGAAQMKDSAQIVRAPIAAAAGFGQHYLGDAGATNLATASTLELPATMRVESWQEYHATGYRWFTDRAIEAAVKAGRLGGLDGFGGEKPIGEMRLHEAEDRAAMERRTKIDLTYEFVMPFPGRRQLPEVATYVDTICRSMDPNGVNVPLRRHFLRFAFEAMAMQDVGHAVEESLPEDGLKGGIGPQEDPVVQQLDADGNPIAAPVGAAASTGQGNAGAGAPKKEDGTPRNVRTKGSDPDAIGETAWIPPELRQAVGELDADLTKQWDALVTDPMLAALAKLDRPEPAAAAGR